MRSSVNQAIWRLFSANGIEIPFTQREVRIVGGMPPSMTAPTMPGSTAAGGAEPADAGNVSPQQPVVAGAVGYPGLDAGRR